MRGWETEAAPRVVLEFSATGASRLTVPLHVAGYPVSRLCQYGPRVPFEPPKPEELEDPLAVTTASGGIAGGC